MNVTRHHVVAQRAQAARGLLARMVGLLGRDALPAGEAMVFPWCNSIHTVGMRFPIDAIFVDQQWQVVSWRSGVRPWRVVWPVRGAWGVVEMAQGTLDRLGLKVGDQLHLAES
ncbi:MAG: DUF192 domain-containing protein [Candidatus Omnitrophica bacterium]|nr:DUF192 domain-containing protein [Candidatus Omnitrophota bacterium]